MFLLDNNETEFIPPSIKSDINYKKPKNVIQLISEFYKCKPDYILPTISSKDALKAITFKSGGQYVLYVCQYEINFLSNSKQLKVGPKNIYRKISTNLNNNNYKYVYLSSPHTYQGYLLNTDEIVNLLLKYTNIIFIIDESYIEYSPGISLISIIDAHDNLIVIRSFNKLYGLNQTGYVCIINNNVQDYKCYVTNVSNYSTYCVEKVLYRKTLLLYNAHQTRLNNMRDNLSSILFKIINELCPISTYNIEFGNYFLIKCIDADSVFKVFLKNGIKVRQIDKCIRITLTLETIDLVIEIIRHINIKVLLNQSTKNIYSLSALNIPTNNIVVPTNAIICTNSSTMPITLCSKYKLDINKIWSGLKQAKDYFETHNIHPLVMSDNQDIITYFVDNDIFDYDVLFVINGKRKDYLEKLKLVKNKNNIYVLSQRYYNSDDDLFIHLGKPTINSNKEILNNSSYYIGTSIEVDGKIARNMNIPYIEIDPKHNSSVVTTMNGYIYSTFNSINELI